MQYQVNYDGFTAKYSKERSFGCTIPIHQVTIPSQATFALFDAWLRLLSLFYIFFTEHLGESMPFVCVVVCLFDCLLF